MQTYNTAPQHSNIMDEIKGGLGKITNGYKSNLLKYAYQRNPDSLLDETLLFIWALMLIACTFTIGYGGYYHYKMLQSAFGVGLLSVIGSFAVFVALEVAKVYMGLVFVRMLFSGIFSRRSTAPIYRALFTAGIGFIVVMAFMWSINISTKGVSMVNASTKTGEMYQAQTFTPPPSVAVLDEQIAAIEISKKAGANSIWEGVTTKQGLRVIKDNTKLQTQLVEQKAAILTAARMQFDSAQTVTKKEIIATATLLTDYGGKAEWAQVVLILLIVLFEFINYENNRAAQPQTAKLRAIDTAHTTQPHSPGFSHNQIGFKLPDTAGQTLVSQATQPTQQVLTQPPDTATQHSHTTTVIMAPSIDISLVKNQCRTYYARSVKPSSFPETREANKGKYLEFRQTLEITGHTVTELENGFLEIEKTVTA